MFLARARKAGHLRRKCSIRCSGWQFTGSAFSRRARQQRHRDQHGRQEAWGGTMSLSERLWRSVRYEEVRYPAGLRQRQRGRRYLSADTVICYDGRRPALRALTARHPIKPTSRRCPSAWQPNPRQTFHLSIMGDSVQNDETTCIFHASPRRCHLPWLTPLLIMSRTTSAL